MKTATWRRIALAGLVAGCVALLAGCAQPTAQVEEPVESEVPVELRVSAATSLKAVLDAVAPEFEQANGVKLVYNFGASGQLQKQIEGGAPADVFASASPAQVDALIEGGLISAASTETFAGNDLVIFVPKGNPAGITKPTDLAKADRLVTGNPETAPHGTKAKEWLEGLGTWSSLGPSFIFAENAAQTLDYVTRGEVDAGIEFESETTGRDDVEVVYLVPADQINPIEYVAAPLGASDQQQVAAAFVEYLLSQKVQTALAEAGFNKAPQQ
jgi:molybdate transport system substrate-binding protein